MQVLASCQMYHVYHKMQSSALDFFFYIYQHILIKIQTIYPDLCKFIKQNQDASQKNSEEF